LQTQVYEALLIFDSNKFARDPAALPAEVEQMVVDGDGEVLVSRVWEERRLAYPINGQRKGTYWLLYFRAPTSHITTMNRRCEIHDGILRQLILKIHPSLVEPILAHAAGATADPEAEGEEAADEPAGEPVGASAE